MICADTKVRIRRDGSTLSVNRVQISDLIYDPIGDRYDEVVDVLDRKIDIRSAANLNLTPFIIQSDCDVTMDSASNLIVSPDQKFLSLAENQKSSGLPILNFRSAKHMPGARMFLGCDVVHYYCIFFERPRTVEVGGLLLRTYTLEDLGNA